MSISNETGTDIKKTFRSEKVASEEVQQERVDYWQEVKDSHGNEFGQL
ncbi:hypothetical protein HCU40_20095 (plasmid) [Pseudanabaena biceps]|nr:hypothetical protein [Pseudanabaena biceps]